MARDRKKQEEDEGQGGDMEERKRVLRHASSLNRADVIKKVVCRTLLSPTSAGHAVSPPSSAGGVGNADDVDREVLNHVDEEGLTALHYAVRKSSLDAIRVLLRLGVNVTARGGSLSAFPNLTAYEVALSGGANGDPREMKQVFLTEAVQAIAQGHSKRLQEFLEAGLEASSEYGADRGGDGESMTLAGWAAQLGRSDMLAALSLANPKDRPDGDTRGGVDGDREAVSVRGAEEGGSKEAGRVSRTEAGGREGCRGEVHDDAGMFVEELRGAIMTLSAEREELESVLSPRGTIGIVERARSARQDVLLAEREVDRAKSLCDQWREEENAAVAENARLQAKVVAAQAAVESYRSGCDPEPDSEPEPDDATPSTGNPEQRDGGASSMAPAEGGAHDGEAVRDEKQTEVEDEETGIDGKDVGSADVVEVRRKEEAAALSSHLQVIVMHLEDELVMMRALAGGEGAVGVVSRIRALRQQQEAAEEDAQQTFSVARYLEARTTVLDDKGDELRSQLGRLEGYLRQPREELLNGNSGATVAGSSVACLPAGKEDIDAGTAALEHDYHGPVLDAFLGGEEEGGTPARSRDGDREHRDESEDRILAPLGDFIAAAGGVVADATADPGAVVPEVWAGGDSGTRGALEELGHGEKQASPATGPSASGVANSEQEGSDVVMRTAAAAASVGAAEMAHTGAPASSGGEAGEGKGGRKVRARALLSAPGVDAARGVKGWRRQRGRGSGEGAGVADEDPKKVSVVQDVLSVLFGWEVAAGDKGGRVGGNMAGKGAGAGVMFA